MQKKKYNNICHAHMPTVFFFYIKKKQLVYISSRLTTLYGHLSPKWIAVYMINFEYIILHKICLNHLPCKPIIFQSLT